LTADGFEGVRRVGVIKWPIRGRGCDDEGRGGRPLECRVVKGNHLPLTTVVGYYSAGRRGVSHAKARDV